MIMNRAKDSALQFLRRSVRLSRRQPAKEMNIDQALLRLIEMSGSKLMRAEIVEAATLALRGRGLSEASLSVLDAQRRASMHSASDHPLYPYIRDIDQNVARIANRN
jgi:hypothetical protein